MAERRWRRVLRLQGVRHVERDVDQEIAFHLEMRTRKLVDAGWDPAAAQARAIEQFGNLPALREECLAIDHDRERTMRFRDFLGSLRQDVAYAVRSLGKQLPFTIAVVLVLAIGIGGNTAIFTLVDGLLLRPLPVSHPESLVVIGDPASVGSRWHGSPMTAFVSYPVYADLRDQNRVLSSLYASGSLGTLDVTVDAPDEVTAAEHPRVRVVSGNFFSTLGVPAFVGRTFTQAEDKVPARDAVAVINYGYWQRRFAGDRSAIGRVIRVSGVPMTIVGVTPPGFVGDVVGSSTDIWLPLMMHPVLGTHENTLNKRTVSWLQMMGRLAPGVTLARARAQLTALETRSIRGALSGDSLAHFDADLAANPVRVEAGARGFSSHRNAYSSALVVLMAAVVLVALVVCGNVANLMLARAMARTRELTVRMALGAGRARMLGLLMTESLVLAVAGGALGLLLASWGSRLLLAIATSGDEPILLDVTPDARIFAFTAAATLITALLFGLVPALRVSRVDVALALRAHGRNLAGAGTRIGRLSAGRTLVVGQIALSTLLLIGAALLVRSLREMLTVDLGLDRAHVLSVQVSPRRSEYDAVRATALLRELTERVRRVPGVQDVGSSSHGLFTGGEGESTILVPGFATRADSDLSVRSSRIGAGFLRAIGARLLRGREFDGRDSERSATVTIIDETMARYYFPNVDPVGRTIMYEGKPITVIGVVRDVEEHDVHAKPVRRLYTLIAQSEEPFRVFVLELRVAGDPARYVAPIRETLLGVDPNLSFEINPLENLVHDSVAQDVLVTRVTAFFGILALLLAAIGLYGVTSYATAQRTGEFGLRTALGAEPNEIARLVLAESARLVVVGLVIGVPTGVLAALLLRAHIFGVSPVDLPSLGAAVVMLMVTALVASYLPARRAARIGPLNALRLD